MTKKQQENIKHAVFEALGEASMAWKPRPSSAEFDSKMAVKIGNRLIKQIFKLTNTGKIPINIGAHSK